MNTIDIILFVIFSAFLLAVFWFLVSYFHDLQKIFYLPKNIFLIKKILIILIIFLSFLGFFGIITWENIFFGNTTFDISRDIRLDF